MNREETPPTDYEFDSDPEETARATAEINDLRTAVAELRRLEAAHEEQIRAAQIQALMVDEYGPYLGNITDELN
jgi:hypothetical protein